MVDAKQNTQQGPDKHDGKVAAEPLPTDIVRYFRVDGPSGVAYLLLREVRNVADEDGVDAKLQVIDPMGTWRYNSKLYDYIESGEAREIAAHDASEIQRERFSLLLPEYQDSLNEGLD